MKRGVLTVSPRALRISLRQTFRTASLTAIPGQTAASSTSLVTNCPAWATRYCSTAKAFGVRGSISVPCHTHALPGSRRKDAKTDCDTDNIVLLPTGLELSRTPAVLVQCFPCLRCLLS